MKKIVALVLSLVMALSLCTVAFAANTRVVYDLDSKNNVNKEVTLVESGITLEKAETKTNKHIAYYDWVVGYEEAIVTTEYYVGQDKDNKEVLVDKDGYDAAKAADEKVTDGTNVDDFMKQYPKWDHWVIDNSTNRALVKEVKTAVGDLNKPIYQYGIPCTQDDADAAVYNNGHFENWIMIRDYNDLAFYDVAATAQAATTKLPNCTTSQYLEDGYLDADGNYYVEDAYENAKEYALNVNGVIVFANDVTDDDDFFIPASHVFAKGVKNDKMGYDVATCMICKGEFACTNNEAIATKTGYKVSNTFTYYSDDAARVYDVNKYANGYDFAWGQAYASDYKFCWALKAGTTEEAGKTTDTTKTGVDSAKTFDAGIAMYVGMSLLSVAGSAVVIGKKKEF